MARNRIAVLAVAVLAAVASGGCRDTVGEPPPPAPSEIEDPVSDGGS